MLGGNTIKAWRSGVNQARYTPNRKSKSYRAGRAIAQLNRGQKPTKYKEKPTPNPLVGKKNVANFAAVRKGERYDYAYDQDTGDVYDIRYDLQERHDSKGLTGPEGGMKVTRVGSMKEYQPVSFGSPHDMPGTIKGSGRKGRKYTGLDAVIKSVRDEGADVFVLDKTPGKGKKASTVGGVPHWRNPIQPIGEYIDPRERHKVPSSGNPKTGYAGTPAKTAHNMFWRQANPISEQEKRARSVLNRGKTEEILRTLRQQPNQGNNPPGAGPTGPTGPGPAGPAPQNPRNPQGPSKPGGQSRFSWSNQGAPQAGPPPNPTKPQGPQSPPPGQTPGPAPSQNQAKPTGTAIQPWRRPKINIPQAEGPTESLEAPNELDQLGYTPQKGRDWYAQKEGAKTQYGTGPNARKMRATEPKSAERPIRTGPVASPPPDDMPPETGPLPLMPPSAISEPIADPAMSIESYTPSRKTGKVRGTPEVTAEMMDLEKKVWQKHGSEAEALGLAQAGNPFRSSPEATKDIARAHELDMMGVTPKAFDNDTLTNPDGSQVKPSHIRLLAGALNDPNLIGSGIIPKDVGNASEYTRKDAGPDALGIGFDGDVRIAGYENLGSNLIKEIETSQNPKVKQALTNIVNENIAKPHESMVRQKGLLLEADKARAEGNIELAKQFEADAKFEANRANLGSTRVLGAFMQERGNRPGYIENTTGFNEEPNYVLPGVFTAAPNSDIATANRLTAPEMAAIEAKMANYTPEQIDSAVSKATMARINLRDGHERPFAHLSDEEAEIARDYQAMIDQKEIDRTKRSWMQTTGQTSPNLADAKGFSGITMTSPVPLDSKSFNSPKELFKQVPPFNADQDVEAQFDRFMATSEDTNFKRGEAQVPIESWSQDPSPDDPALLISHQVASQIARASVNESSKAALGLGISAGESASMLQGQEGRGEDAGYGPQRTNHFRTQKNVEEMLWNVEHGTGKVPGMDEIGRRTYERTIEEVYPEVQAAIAGMSPEELQNEALTARLADDIVNTRMTGAIERTRNPEADTSGAFNPLAMPNTRGLNQDDPTRSTLQQIVTDDLGRYEDPNGTPIDVIRRDSMPTPNAEKPLDQLLPYAEANLAKAFKTVDEQETERKQTFWEGILQENAAFGTNDSMRELAERQLASITNIPYKQSAPDSEAARIAAELGVTTGTSNAVKGRMGLRRSTAYKPRVNTTPGEKDIQAADVTERKQWRRQERDLFSNVQAKGRNPNPNEIKIHADQFMVGDEVSIAVPGKEGSRSNKFVGAEVVDVTPEGYVTLEDGPTYGTVRLDPDDPNRSSVYVSDFARPDPDYAAELAEIESAQAPAPAIEPLAPIASVDPIESVNMDRPKRKGQGSKTPGLMPEAFDRLQGTVLHEILYGGSGKILSKSVATKRSNAHGMKYADGYDSANFPTSWSNKIFSKSKGASPPDEVHAYMVNSGLMPEGSTVDDMMDMIDKGIRQYGNEVERVKGEKVATKQFDRQEKELFVQRKSKGKPINPNAISGSELVVGQQLLIAVPNARGRTDKTELVDVVDIDEDGGAILEDGEHYGPEIRVPADRKIYYKEFRDENPELADIDPWVQPELDTQVAETPKRRKRQPGQDDMYDVPF
jgi:hypothetical protein